MRRIFLPLIILIYFGSLFSQTQDSILVDFTPDYLPKESQILVSYTPDYLPKESTILVSFTPDYAVPLPTEAVILVSFTPSYLPPLPREGNILVSFTPDYLPKKESIVVSFAPDYYALSVSTDGVVNLSYKTATLQGEPTSPYIVIVETTTEEFVVAVATAIENGLGVYSNLYDIGPDGTVFEPEAILTFSYTEPDFDETLLDIYRWDIDTGWQKLEALERNLDENWIKVSLSSIASIFAILYPDKMPPVVKIIKPEEGEILSDEVEVKVEVKDNTGVKKLEIYLDEEFISDKEEFMWDTEEVSDGTHTIKAVGYDFAGNFDIDKITVTVDNTKPTITILSPKEGEKYIAKISTITIDFNISDNLDPEPVYYAYLKDLEEGTTIQVHSGDEILPLDIDDGFWEMVVEARDWAGNYSSATSGAFEVIHDILPPRTAISHGEPDYIVNGSTHITSETPITLTAVDDLIEVGDGIGLGVDKTWYRVSSKQIAESREWEIYEEIFTITGEDGIYYVDYYSVDVIGNQELVKRATYYLDNTAPYSELEVGEPKYQEGEDLYVSTGTPYYLTTIDPVINGVSSGLRYSQWQKDNESWQTVYPPVTDYKLPLIFEEGKHTIYYKGVDNLGNEEEEKSLKVLVDATPPITTISINEPKYIIAGSTYITSDSEITLSAIDPVSSEVASGVKEIWYRVSREQ
ncbi:MAG: hypothetical protein DRI36_03250 [Caldiserica bacterium]|nr:MAG: hypothetical protein DRI36_03250 [Caldisericota bacterium]